MALMADFTILCFKRLMRPLAAKPDLHFFMAIKTGPAHPPSRVLLTRAIYKGQEQRKPYQDA